MAVKGGKKKKKVKNSPADANVSKEAEEEVLQAPEQRSPCSLWRGPYWSRSRRRGQKWRGEAEPGKSRGMGFREGSLVFLSLLPIKIDLHGEKQIKNFPQVKSFFAHDGNW